MPEWLLSLMLLLVVPCTLGAQPAAQEYEIKAVLLFHFAELVDWPSEASVPVSRPLTICAFDNDPAARDIRRMVAGRGSGSRAVRFQPVHIPQDALRCQMLFLSRWEARRQASTLKVVEKSPVLSVGETDSFLSDGGMIRFHPDSGRVRFDVNVGAAEACGLKISSRLLLHASYILRNSPQSLGGR